MPRFLILLLFLCLTSTNVPLTAQEQSKTIEVRDRASGKPIEGASVTNSNPGNSEIQYTDTTGHASLHFLDPGEHKLEISEDGYTDLIKSWNPVSGETVFRLTPSGAARPGTTGPLQSSGEQSLPMDVTQLDARNSDSSNTGGSPNWKEALWSALSTLFFALLPLIAYFGVREIAVRTTAHFMMRRRLEPISQASKMRPETSTPSTAALEFMEISRLNGILLNGPAEARLERASATQRRKLNILLLSFLAQVLFLAPIVGLIAWRFADTRQLAMDHALRHPLLAILVGPILLVADVMIPLYAWTTYLQGLRIIELLGILTGILISAIGIAGIFLGTPFYLLVLPTISQLAVLGVGWRRIRQAARSEGNRNIVVLRVFGSDKNAAFVFGSLMSKWRFIGSYLTIVDPAYIRYQFSVLSSANAGKSLGTTLTLGTLLIFLNLATQFLPAFAPGILPASWSSLTPDQQQSRIQAVAYVVLSVLAILPLMFYIRRRFLKTPSQAVEYVGRLKGADLSLESDYPGSALFCFDDVWKPAVHKMLEIADVVLMDLRGFSEQRQGCAYEIGELIDSHPVERLLFLTDTKTPKELLHTLIRDRWAKMKSDSPNRTLTHAVIKLYQAGNRDKRDLPRIEALLSASLQGRVQLDNVGLAHWAA
jgi:hypothetical protein